MEAFLNEIIEWEKFELLIDIKVFNKDIILKSVYQFLDRGYFFFKFNNEWNIILQFSKREDNNEKPIDVIADFSDELLSTYLREKLEIENKDIREVIVGAAIWNSLDSNNFVSLNTNNTESNQIDFDKDIDEILKEINNDPELSIDEEEIERILKEIEDEEVPESKNIKPSITLDPSAIKKAKDLFNK